MPSQIFSWNKSAEIHSMQRFTRQLGICLSLANAIAAFCSHKISDGVSKQLTAKEVPEEQTAGSRDDMLGKHQYTLVLPYLFEVDTDGGSQGAVVSLRTVVLTIHSVTVPPPLLAAERIESRGTSS